MMKFQLHLQLNQHLLTSPHLHVPPPLNNTAGSVQYSHSLTGPWTEHLYSSAPSQSLIMSGKRILDALAMFNAGRSIAAKHLDIRFSQAKLYGQSSSIVKAVRTQAPPTVAAAASRFASSSSSQPSREGIRQDHFYTRSDANSSQDQPASEDLNVEQARAKRNPLPDGTIPPQDSPIGENTNDGITFNRRPVGEPNQNPLESEHTRDNLTATSSQESTIPTPHTSPLSPDQARLAQRQSEYQIPSTSADPPTPGETPGQNEFAIEQEQDLFYQPPESSSPVLSALPRVRVPKTENDVQEGDSHIPPGINADVYYSGAKGRDSLAEEPSDEVLANLFHSPKTAKMFGVKAKYAPGGVGGPSKREFHSLRTLRQKESAAADADAQSIRQLAADIDKDARSSNVR